VLQADLRRRAVPADGYAAFLWARKLVITTFPVGISVPAKSELVITSGKLGENFAHRVSEILSNMADDNNNNTKLNGKL